MSKESFGRREFLSSFKKNEKDTKKETGDILFNQYAIKEFKEKREEPPSDLKLSFQALTCSKLKRKRR